MSPESKFRPIQLNPVEEEKPPEEQLVEQPMAQVAEEKPRTQFRPIQVEQPPQEQPKEEGFFGHLERGFERSAAGETSGALFGRAQETPQEQPPGFWDSVIEEVGTLAGDAPFMAIGGSIGAAIGSAGGPLGTIVGGGAGAFAFPAFLKEASRQYRQFQDEGGDLTFGEFLERADKVANTTLREGAFGIILGSVKSGMNLLRKIPAVDQLFNTRYIGPVAREATTIGAEVAAGTAAPAIAEQRLPSAEDVARSAVLFSGGRLSHIPGQLTEVIREATSPKFKYALADRVEKLNLAYPALQEFKEGENPVYKNSVELDRNLTAFDKSVTDNVVSRINSLSPTEFASADEAGTRMKEMLSPLTATEIPTVEPGTPEPVKPVERPVPLVENPLQKAMVAISGNAASSKADLGKRITKQYQEGRKTEKEPLTRRYKQQEQAVSGYDVVDENAADKIQSFISEFEPGAIPGSQAATIVNNAKVMLDLFVQRDKEGNIAGYKAVPMRKLISSNRSVKQIPNWDTPPEMIDNLNTLTQQIDQIIVGQLNNVSPDLALEYQNLNADYALFKNRWDNNDMRIFYDRTENSEAVTNRFSSLDEFTQLEQALSGTPGGQQALNMLRREVWRDKLGKDAVNAKTEAAFEKATRDLTMRDLRDLQEYLTPEQREATTTAMQRSNQIRTSAIKSSEKFSKDKEVYERQMEQWKEKEKVRSKKNKEKREEVQSKQELLVSLLKEDPAQLVGNMESIEGIRRMKEATRKVENGKDLYDSLARYETERMFDFMKNGYLRTGRVPYTELKVRMQAKEFRAKLKELNGEKFVREMDELVETTDKLSKNFKEHVVEFRDDPTTLNTVLQIYSLLGLAQGDIMTPLMAFTAKKNLLKIGNKTWNMWTGRKNYDQAHIHRALNAARAVQRGNKQEIRRQQSILNIPYQIESP